jgi:hypothetical protein
MARGKPVEIATRSFENQSKAVEHFREILGRYRPGDRVSDDDALDLSALLERHDEYAQKVGKGVDHFEVMATEHGTNCFRIVRIDGTGTDFSYRHCITQRPPTRKQEVSAAFRRVVQLDLYAARDKFFSAHRGDDGKVSCAVTGERILRDEAHMDHRPPMTFEVIVTTFLEGRGMSLDQVPITSGRDEQVSPEVTDEALAEAFRGYHSRVAKLDIVKSAINLAQSSRNRIKDGRVKLT